MPFKIRPHSHNDDDTLVLQGHPHLTDQDLAGLARLPEATRRRIRIALLADTPLTDTGVRHLQALPGLRELYLQGTRISDQVPLMPLLGRLEALNLDRTAIGDATLARLHPAQGLGLLSARQTRISDQGMHALTRLGSLREVYLAGTAVTPEARRCLDNALYRPGLHDCLRWALFWFCRTTRQVDQYLTIT
jgi:hypothetical protein